MRNWIGLTLPALALALAGCGKEADKTQGGGTAAGEILPGSVSDAMVPVDQLKSQTPLAPKTEAADKKAAKPGEKPKAAPVKTPAEAAAPAAPDEPAAEE